MLKSKFVFYTSSPSKKFMRRSIQQFRPDTEDGVVELINTIFKQRALPTLPQPLLRRLL